MKTSKFFRFTIAGDELNVAELKGKIPLDSSVYYKDETYEKFISSLMSNDELEFRYKGIGYSIVHNPPYVYFGRNVSFVNKEYKTEKVESYLSISELLDKVVIDGKKISEIWKDIEVSVI